MAECIATVLTQAVRSLNAEGIDNPRHEARLLLAAVLDQTPLDLIRHPQQVMSTKQQDHFWDWVGQRCRRRSIGHILGRREFWSLEFRVSAEALEPRPDSECLVSAAVAHLLARDDEEMQVLDLGVGTGCLLLSVLHEVESAIGFGIDIGPELCRLARRNATLLGLAERTQWIAADWLTALDASFDVILANPPYIPQGSIAGLMPEVASYEPRRALAGGVDGLECYRRMMPMIEGHLKPGGALFLEVGYDQADQVIELSRQSGLCLLDVVRDLAGRDRCLVLSLEQKTKKERSFNQEKMLNREERSKKVLESPNSLLS